MASNISSSYPALTPILIQIQTEPIAYESIGFSLRTATFEQTHASAWIELALQPANWYHCVSFASAAF